MAPKYKNSIDFYKKNPDKAQKKSDDNNSGKGGKYAHTDKYKREHKAARKRLDCPKSKDVVKKKGKWTCESLKINRGRGGSKRK